MKKNFIVSTESFTMCPVYGCYYLIEFYWEFNLFILALCITWWSAAPDPWLWFSNGFILFLGNSRYNVYEAYKVYENLHIFVAEKCKLSGTCWETLLFNLLPYTKK